MLVEGDALTVVASGYMVHVAMKAAARSGEGRHQVHAGRRLLLAAERRADPGGGAQASGQILTVEDNYVGGFWSAVAEAAAEQGDTRVVGMTVRRIPKSGTPDDVMKYVGLSPEDVAAKIKTLVG